MTRPTCPAPHHGTAWDYNAHGCRCPEAIAARNAQRTRSRARVQASTALTAASYALPWDSDSDAELLNGPGTLTQRAERLGRTFWAARNRLTRLRAQEANA